MLGSQTRSARRSPSSATSRSRRSQQGRSHIDAHVDYVDFDGKLGDGYDQYYQAEIDFTYRFLEPVYAVRLGFGTLSGIGGPKDVIDADPMRHVPRRTAARTAASASTFSYVYTELEYRLRPNVALMLRPQAGLLTTDIDVQRRGRPLHGRPTSTAASSSPGFGARGRLRLGDESGTNLVLGAAFTRGVGTLLEAAYNWRPSPVVPVQLTVQVTDQPVPEDFGVRLIADVGVAQPVVVLPVGARVVSGARHRPRRRLSAASP